MPAPFNGSAPTSDKTPPTAPGTPVITNALSNETVTVTVTASTDAVGVVGYAAFLDGNVAEAGRSTSVVINLAKVPAGSHSVVVKAFDAAGNLSAGSVTTVFNMPALFKDSQSSIIRALRDLINKPTILEKAAEPVAITWSTGGDYLGTAIAGGVLQPFAVGVDAITPATINPAIYSSTPLMYVFSDQGRQSFSDVSGKSSVGFIDTGTVGAITFCTDAPKFEFDLNCTGGSCRIQMLVDGKRIADKHQHAGPVTSIGTTAGTIAPNATSVTLSAAYATSLAGLILCDVNGNYLARITAHTAGTTALTVSGIHSNNSSLRGTNNSTTIAALTAMYISASAGNIRKCILVDFGFSKMRTITLITGGHYSGVNLPPNYRLYNVKKPAITALMFGDSIGAYSGIYDFQHSLGLDLFAAIGLSGCTSSSIGGTGYQNRGAGPYMTPLERLTARVNQGTSYIPDVLYMQTAINDSTNMETSLLASITTEVTNFYNYCSTVLPNTLIIANGSWGSNPVQVIAHPGHVQIGLLVLARLQAGNNPFIFLDFLNGSIITSWGIIYDGSIEQVSYSYHPDSVITLGNFSQYIQSDPHPTSPELGFGESESWTGTVYASKWVLNAVRQALNSYR